MGAVGSIPQPLETHPAWISLAVGFLPSAKRLTKLIRLAAANESEKRSRVSFKATPVLNVRFEMFKSVVNFHSIFEHFKTFAPSSACLLHSVACVLSTWKQHVLNVCFKMFTNVVKIHNMCKHFETHI